MNEDERSLLERVSAWIASAFGGIMLLVAVVFATRWGVREGLLGGHPEIGLGIGLVIGTVGLVIAELFWVRDQRALAAGVAGSGLGILYFSLYAAHAWYDLLGSSTTSVSLLAVTAIGALQAVRRDSELMAVLGFVGGMATPLLLGPHAGPYLAYLVVLNVAVAASSLWRNWRVLPWLGIGSTLLLTFHWITTDDSARASLLTSVSAAMLGGLYALIAAHPRIPTRAGVPWLVGALGGLALALPFIGVGFDIASSVVIPLVAVSVHCALLRIAAERHEGDLRTGMLAMVYAMGCLAIVLLAIRWLMGGMGDATTAVALVVVPALIAKILAVLVDGERVSSTLFWASSLIGASMIVVFGDVQQPWIVAIAVTGTGLFAGISRMGLAWASGPLRAFSVIAAALCLVPGNAPWAALLTGLVVLGLTVLPALFSERPALPADLEAPAPIRAVLGYLPLLVSPFLLVPLLLSWRQLTGDAYLGVIPLLLGAVSAMGLGVTTLREPPGLARSMWWALTVTFATVALPMQLEAQWLTVGLAAEGAALLLVGSRNRIGFLSAVGLGLLAIITVRLVANPAVLDYHLVKQPHLASWVWYGYGLPALALVFAAQVSWVPERWGLVLVRRGLEMAALVVGFCGLNLVVSHGFAGGDTLTFIDTGDAARAMRTVIWSVYGVVLLALGGRAFRHWPRASFGLVLLGASMLKLSLLDLWLLDILPSALELTAVAACAFVAAGLLGRASHRPRALSVDAP